ncbi:unnamed protein product [Rotaria sp. Silwood2]|nr:unnamed protein product [Rotaria sp. Silwood2]
MATGIDVENDPDAHGESDDNVSDDEDWPRRTKSGIRRYPDIPMDGKYTRPLDFYRHTVGYGDGGCLDLDYPIWLCGAISEHISDANTDVRKQLLEVFNKMNEERQDFHKYPLPVEDIIDPDLLVCRPVKPRSPPSPDPKNNDEHNIFNYGILFNPDKKWNFDPSSLRGSYQWIPSEFRIRHSIEDYYEVHIETPISHLPMTDEYAQTYRNLEKLFSKLMPMFNEILKINDSINDTRLQVAVKVQSYNIQPRTNYSGRWHTEGCSENIQAVGVYYLHIDDLLEGGALKFRPLAAPAESYADCWNIEVNRYMMPKTDVAVVFDNCLPHRFCSIRNSTSIARRRTFINFFVVSPTYPIHDISILDLPLVSCEQCEYLLKSIADESHRQKLPDLVINKILSFLKKQMWTTETDAKEFRSRVRYEMVHEKSGWSGIQYGNTGDIIFIKSTDDLKQLGKISAYEDLSRHPYHTESE